MSNFFTSRFQTIGDFFSSQSFSVSEPGRWFSWEFWTEGNLLGESRYIALSWLVVTVAVAGIAVWRRSLKKQHRQTPVYDWPVNQLLNVNIFIVIVSLSYWFFRSQQLSYLSSRLVALVSLLVVVFWIGWVAWRLKKILSADRVAYLEKERFFRYLPKSKKVRN